MERVRYAEHGEGKVRLTVYHKTTGQVSGHCLCKIKVILAPWVSRWRESDMLNMGKARSG